MWFIFSLLSAVFAALTSILAKIGIDGVNSNLATAIRTVVVVIMAWVMVFVTNAQSGITEISRKSWIFLILSGLATGASWLCYYKALQIGEASKVVPIDKLSVVITLVLAFVFLHEKFTVKSLIGCLLIGAGTLVMVLWFHQSKLNILWFESVSAIWDALFYCPDLEIKLVLYALLKNPTDDEMQKACILPQKCDEMQGF